VIVLTFNPKSINNSNRNLEPKPPDNSTNIFSPLYTFLVFSFNLFMNSSSSKNSDLYFSSIFLITLTSQEFFFDSYRQQCGI